MSTDLSFEELDAQAEALLSAGKPAEALKIYEHAIVIHSGEAAAWTNHGRALDALGRIEESLVSFEKALSLDGRQQSALANKARALRELGKMDAALMAIQEAIELDENVAPPWNIFGATLEMQKRNEEAAAAFEKAVSLDPANKLYEDNLARVTALLGKDLSALGALDAALEIHPRAWAVAFAKADVLRRHGEPRDAVRAYEFLSELRPQDVKIWCLKGEMCSERGLNQEALDAYECALALDRNCAAAWIGKADILERIKLPRAAAAAKRHDLPVDYELAERTNEGGMESTEPNLPEPPPGMEEFLQRVFSEIDTIEIDEWLTKVRNESAHFPEQGLLWLVIGDDLDKRGNSEAALNAYRRAMKSNPDSLLVWIMLAAYFEKAGKLKDELDCWSHVLVSRDSMACYPARLCALERLTTTGGRDDVAKVLRLALRDAHHAVRTAALDKFIERGDASLAQELEAALTDVALGIRVKSISSVACVPEADARRLLVLAMKNESWEVRELGVNAVKRQQLPLKQIPQPTNEEHPKVRVAIVRALGGFAEPSATRQLLRSSTDEVPEVRVAAIEALRTCAALPQVRRSLEASLTDWHVSPVVLSILEKVGWQSKGERDDIHAALARRDARTLKASPEKTRRVLLGDIRYENYGGFGDDMRRMFGVDPTTPEFRKYRTIENALYAFIGLGQSEILPTLIDVLNNTEDKITAEAYLNCGQSQLNAAAHEWARKRNYTVHSGPGAHPVSWGSM